MANTLRLDYLCWASASLLQSLRSAVNKKPEVFSDAGNLKSLLKSFNSPMFLSRQKSKSSQLTGDPTHSSLTAFPTRVSFLPPFSHEGLDHGKQSLTSGSWYWLAVPYLEVAPWPLSSPAQIVHEVILSKTDILPPPREHSITTFFASFFSLDRSHNM